MTALAAAGAENRTTRAGAHALPETVRLGTTTVVGLVRTLRHDNSTHSCCTVQRERLLGLAGLGWNRSDGLGRATIRRCRDVSGRSRPRQKVLTVLGYGSPWWVVKRGDRDLAPIDPPRSHLGGE